VASARELPGLADYDFPVTTSNASSLVTYLADFEKANEEKLPVEFVSAHMGWVNNMRGFLIGRDYLGEDPPVYFRGADDGDEQLADDYSCAGTFEEWRRAVEAISHYLCTPRSPRRCLRSCTSRRSSLTPQASPPAARRPPSE
jgi:hypothetical protein